MQDECRRVQRKRRGWRRHHKQRIVQKFKRIVALWNLEDLDTWAKKTASRGSIGCGCCCCGNPRRQRKVWGEETLTVQERKALEDANDQLNKNYEYVNGCVVDSAYWN